MKLKRRRGENLIWRSLVAEFEPQFISRACLAHNLRVCGPRKDRRGEPVRRSTGRWVLRRERFEEEFLRLLVACCGISTFRSSSKSARRFKSRKIPSPADWKRKSMRSWRRRNNRLVSLDTRQRGGWGGEQTHESPPRCTNSSPPRPGPSRFWLWR